MNVIPLTILQYNGYIYIYIYTIYNIVGVGQYNILYESIDLCALAYLDALIKFNQQDLY